MRPIIVRASVLFPQPLSPTIPTVSPRLNVRLIARSTGFFGPPDLERYATSTCCNRTSGSAPPESPVSRFPLIRWLSSTDSSPVFVDPSIPEWKHLTFHLAPCDVSLGMSDWHFWSESLHRGANEQETGGADNWGIKPGKGVMRPTSRSGSGTASIKA